MPLGKKTQVPFDDTGKTLRSQKILLDKLRKENETLQAELSAEVLRASSGHGSEPIIDPADLARLEDQADEYVAKVEMATKKLQRLEKEVEDAERDIVKARQKRGTVDHRGEQIRLCKNLEHRLGMSGRKYDETLAKNKMLRETINDLRKEHSMYKQIFRRREAELAKQAEETERIMAEARHALEKRNDFLQAQLDIKAKSEKEIAEFISECRDIGQQLLENARVDTSVLEPPALLDLPTHLGKLTVAEETELRRKHLKGQQQIEEDRKTAARLKEMVTEFETAFEQIQKATSFQSVEVFVSHFINMEDENFHRFQYLNTLNNDIEKLKEEIEAMKREEQQYKNETTNSDQHWDVMVQALEAKHSKINQQSQENEGRLAEDNNTIEKLRQMISRMFTTLGCSADDALLGAAPKKGGLEAGAAGGGGGVHIAPQQDTMGQETSAAQLPISESNILQYLGVIESKAVEYIVAYTQALQATQSTGGNRNKHAVNPLQMGRDLTPRLAATSFDEYVKNTIPRELPSVRQEDESRLRDDDDDHGELPLSEQQLRHKALISLNLLRGDHHHKTRSRLGKTADSGLSGSLVSSSMDKTHPPPGRRGEALV